MHSEEGGGGGGGEEIYVLKGWERAEIRCVNWKGSITVRALLPMKF